MDFLWLEWNESLPRTLDGTLGERSFVFVIFGVLIGDIGDVLYCVGIWLVFSVVFKRFC